MGFCNDITPNCDTCHTISYGNCNDVLTISLGLNPLTDFFLTLTDKFDIVTNIDVTSDGSGAFNLTQTWTEFFGAIEVTIFSDSNRTILVPFIVNSTNFNCLILQT